MSDYTFLYSIRTRSGERLETKARSFQEAIGKLKISEGDVKRFMPLTCPELQAEVAEAKRIKRAQYKEWFGDDAPKAEGKGDKETAMKSKKSKKASPKLEQARQQREENAKKREEESKPSKKKAAKPIQVKALGLPEKFIRKFHGKDFTVEQNGDGWLLDDKPVDTLKDAMLAILKTAKTDPSHRAAKTFFKPSKIQPAA